MSKLDKNELIELGLVEMFYTPSSMKKLQDAYSKLSKSEAAVAAQFAHMGWNGCLHTMNEMEAFKPIVEVVFAHDDSGNCREYYRIKGTKTLVCRQEEVKDVFVWYTCTQDGVYNEPVSQITQLRIKIVKEEK